ncbi:hypothetical protein [Streptomyces sp. NPDC059761]|uniref:hypothetical protein n=1 Tax=unclassified Streptomyces TaxID=2593676 RepID=UPI003654C764
MKTVKRVGAVLGTTVLTATTLLGVSTSAQASSWNCYSEVTADRQSAYAFCDGDGPMRVAAYCDLDRYPYRTTVYGSWGGNGSSVHVSSCYISKAWYEVP